MCLRLKDNTTLKDNYHELEASRHGNEIQIYIQGSSSE